MDLLAVLEQGIRDFILDYSKALLLLIFVVIVLRVFARRASRDYKGHRFRNQLLAIVLVLITLVGLILTLPLNSEMRGQLLTLLGLVLTAVLTLSSPTVAANAMAGFMLRSVQKFAPGDFIHVENHFGRVTELGLFHTEIQTEDRDLLTLPNLFLSSHPIKVVHADGTVVSAEVTLGYDIDHHLIEAVLLQAAEDAQLEEPFVYVMELGDFSVCYRVSGFLRQVKTLLSARSLLRKKMMDRLHEQHIEIVSPGFMNQRQVTEEIIPERSFVMAENSAQIEPEKLIFDKAERAQQLEELKQGYEELKAELKALDESNDSNVDSVKPRKLRRLKAMKRAISVLEMARNES